MNKIAILCAVFGLAAASWYVDDKDKKWRDACHCYREGNLYSVAGSCDGFYQETADLTPVWQSCPAGLQFNTKNCVCDYPENTVCEKRCDSWCYSGHWWHGKARCHSKGNAYAPLPKTGCTSFTQATRTLPPQVLSCPAGLMFDVKTCVCNYPKNTSCYY